jgi:hypothetical protein
MRVWKPMLSTMMLKEYSSQMSIIFRENNITIDGQGIISNYLQ